MPDEINQIVFNQFDAGWIISDSPENGRKNGLLKMDNVELDKNGSLSLTGGCAKVGSAYTYPAHSIWSRSMGGTRTDYISDTNGGILRNGSSIATGGSTSLCAFGDAYKYVLIASGGIRKKDTGSGTPLNLGIVKPSAGPSLNKATSPFATTDVVANSDIFDDVIGTTNFGVYPFEQTCDGTDGHNAIQTLTTPTYHGPYDYSNTIYSTLTLPPDEDDYLNAITVTTTGFFADLTVVIDFLLDDPGASGDEVANYYRAAVGPGFWVSPLTNNQFSLRRSAFDRIGTSQADWSKVYGVRITCISSDNTDVVTVDFVRGFYGGFNGSIQYAQVNVNSNGSYLGKSEIGPISYVYLDNQLVDVTVQDPTGVDTQCNQAWIFRRGGDLDQWYRVKVVTSPWASFTDLVTDVDAITLKITLNTNLISINVASIAADILAIVGPIEGRWFYFTGDTMYPSDINNPDLIDVTKGVNFSNANNEQFLWAVKVSDEAVLVGTSLEVYLLTGTFATLPDFTIDVYKRALGCKHPPISYDVTYYDGSAIYIAADGWRAITPGGQSTLLVAPNTDRIYRETVLGYVSLVVGVAPAARRYPCVVAQNKLWCGISGTNRIEVLDLTRKYWRNIDYGVGIVCAITKASDGNIVAMFNGSGIGAGIYLRNVGIRSSLQIDATTNQTVTILSPVFDGQMLRNRKDALTLKCRMRGGAALLGILVIDEFGNSTNLGTVSSNTSLPVEKYLDASTIPVSRTYQFSLTGAFLAFELSDVTLDFESRPAPLTQYIMRPSNFGKSSLKKTRQWPLVIDSLGNNVTCTPRVDGSNKTGVVITSSEKTTKIVYFDILGTDIGMILSGGPFELYDPGRPEFLEVNPVPRLFDSVGPIEIYRFGKIARLRVHARTTGVVLNWVLWVNDENVANGILTTLAGLENHYEIPIPKGIEGTVMTLELGSSTNTETFERYGVEIMVSESGNQTDKTWKQLVSAEQQ